MFATPQVRQGRLKALTQDKKKANIYTDQQLSKVANKSEQNIAIPEYMDVQDMDARVKSMMEAGPNVLPHGKGQIRAKICKVCGKEGAPSAIRDHIEVHHLEGIFLGCSTCEKTFKSRTSLRLHNCKNILNVWFLVLCTIVQIFWISNSRTRHALRDHTASKHRDRTVL